MLLNVIHHNDDRDNRAWLSPKSIKKMEAYEEDWKKNILAKKKKNKDLELAYKYMTMDVDGRGRITLCGLTEEAIGIYNAAVPGAADDDEAEDKATRKRERVSRPHANKRRSGMMKEYEQEDNVTEGMPDIKITLEPDISEKSFADALALFTEMQEKKEFNNDVRQTAVVMTTELQSIITDAAPAELHTQYS